MGEALEAAADRLARAGVPQARREAELLLGWVLGTDRGGVIARKPDPLDAAVAEKLAAAVFRRERREPPQYLTGEQEFHGLSFLVDHRVLVPRPETEGVVDAVLGLALPEAACVADLGTGSGCIAVSLARSRPDLRLFALDVSSDALEVARANAARLEVVGKIQFVHADLSRPPDTWRGAMHAVACNPPYVSEDEWDHLAPEVHDHEPRVALVPGPSGLEAYPTVAASAFRLLRPRGSLVVELGFGREEGARRAAVTAGFGSIRVLPDLRGIPRVLVAQKAA